MPDIFWKKPINSGGETITRKVGGASSLDGEGVHRSGWDGHERACVGEHVLVAEADSEGAADDVKSLGGPTVQVPGR